MGRVGLNKGSRSGDPGRSSGEGGLEKQLKELEGKGGAEERLAALQTGHPEGRGRAV